MARKKKPTPDEKVGLKLTQAERKLVLEEILPLPKEVEKAVRASPATGPVRLSLDDLEDLARHVAAAADHAEDQTLRAKLDRIARKIDALLDRSITVPDLPEGRAAGVIESFRDMLLGEGATILPLPSKSKEGEDQYPLTLTDKQREALLSATRLRRGLKNRIGQAPEDTQTIGLTRKELDEMAEEVDTSLAFAPSPFKKRLEAVLGKLDDLLDALEEDEPGEPGPEPAEPTGRIYQLKITLKDTKPPVWRRVEVPDCTLGDLHEVIQIAMGWDNSHLHQFVVRGTYYGPSADDDFGFGMDMEVEDEEGVLLSQIVTGGRKLKFRYEYDFGDGWRHDIEVERVVEREPRVKYPRCVEGRRACPPEDVGGPWGYADFLAVIADPKHPDHREMKEWAGGRFDPEKFSVEAVNKELRALS
jgi:hypothetical protein